MVVGLGNPGPRYADTRHNAGRLAVDHLARRHAVAIGSVKFNARFGQLRLDSQRLLLVLPQTYMNQSGQAVAPLARFYQVRPERILTVYDDLDLPLGRLRLRAEGGAGGHNGVASLIQALGTPAFPRLRLGIGRPPAGWEGVDYVLGRFTEDERGVIDACLPEAADAMECAAREGITAAMNRFNRRD
jgi:PTH1 family peptidyl-tRNA hydrolase